jgi:hypothetical protein
MPWGVLVPALIVIVTVQVGRQDGLEKLDVVPAGSPDALKLTLVDVPDVSVAVMPAVAALPCTTVTLPPLLIEKLNGGCATV